MSVMLICLQFKQDTPRQLVHKSVQGTPHCWHVQFLREQSVLQPHLTIFSNSFGAISFVISTGITPLGVICQPQSKRVRSLLPFPYIDLKVNPQNVLLRSICCWPKFLRSDSFSRCASQFVKILPTT